MGDVYIMPEGGDGTVTEALQELKPDIFAKGGDRRDDAAMPASEIEVCDRLGIQIVYGAGDLLASSSDFVIDVVRHFRHFQK